MDDDGPCPWSFVISLYAGLLVAFLVVSWIYWKVIEWTEFIYRCFF